MPIILITASNGHGKGQFAIKTILDLQAENDKREKQGLERRQIYANIHGINADGKKPLRDVLPIPSDYIFFGKQDNPDDPPPDGYFVPPIGSIFIYDECQKIDWIKQKAGALSTDIRVRSMEEHRHAGLDIYLITQSPNYIHSHIFGLVSPHYYLERPLNLPITNVFKFVKPKKNPENAKNKADDHFQLKLGKGYGAYYQSSLEHNMKSQIPLKLKLGILVLVGCILSTYYNYTQTKYYDKAEQETAQAEQEQSQTPTTQANDPKGEVEQGVRIVETKNDELEVLRLKQEIENLKRKQELYDKMLPKDYAIIKSDPNLQVRGVIANGTDCKAYNTNGDLMTLGYDDCTWYLAEYGRVHKGDNVAMTGYSPQSTLKEN